MQRARALLIESNLDPRLLSDYARETMEALRYHDWYAFRDATRRFCVGSWDETGVLVFALRVYGGFMIGDLVGAGVAFVISGGLMYWHKINN